MNWTTAVLTALMLVVVTALIAYPVWLMFHGAQRYVGPAQGYHNVYNADRQFSDHLREPRYLLPPPAERPVEAPDRKELYIHVPAHRKSAP